MRRSNFRIADPIAEAIIREAAWRGATVLKPLYRIREITLGGDEIIVERDYMLNEVDREIMYGAQYEDAMLPHKINENDYHLGSLPFSVKEWDERPLGV